MKNQVLILLILSFGFGVATNPGYTFEDSEHRYLEYSCPPYDENSGSTLMMFLTSDRYQENRKETGMLNVGNVNPHEVLLSDDNGQASVCKKLREDYPWPRDHYSIAYFKIDQRYFVVNSLNIVQPEDEGKINIQTGNSFMIVLDEELNRIGYFLH